MQQPDIVVPISSIVSHLRLAVTTTCHCTFACCTTPLQPVAALSCPASRHLVPCQYSPGAQPCKPCVCMCPVSACARIADGGHVADMSIFILTSDGFIIIFSYSLLFFYDLARIHSSSPKLCKSNKF